MKVTDDTTTEDKLIVANEEAKGEKMLVPLSLSPQDQSLIGVSTPNNIEGSKSDDESFGNDLLESWGQKMESGKINTSFNNGNIYDDQYVEHGNENSTGYDNDNDNKNNRRRTQRRNSFVKPRGEQQPMSQEFFNEEEGEESDSDLDDEHVMAHRRSNSYLESMFQGLRLGGSIVIVNDDNSQGRRRSRPGFFRRTLGLEKKDELTTIDDSSPRVLTKGAENKKENKGNIFSRLKNLFS